jgi:hypothetical protein
MARAIFQWTLVGAGEGPADASEAHDRYLVGTKDATK